MAQIRAIFVLIFFLGQCFLNCSGFPSMPTHDPISAIQSLIERRIPSVINNFSFRVIPTTNEGLDAFEIEQIDDKIQLSGSSATALASALNWYLKDYGLGQMSWNAVNLDLPTKLPKVDKKIRMERQSRYSYYQNVCTVSYSMWNWEWPRWERHIDWMALNGINMPLAFTGQEKVWQNTFKKYFNISQEGIDNFFSGPAFLAWQRMGNLQGSWVKGPLPQKFIDRQYQVQLKILNRMKEFGMLAALPGFAGHVPGEMKQKYPYAKMSIAAPWGGFVGRFSGVLTVEPTDPLFIDIGKKFIEEQTLLYNYTSSLYQMDTYNEMDPISEDLTYLADSSKSVFDAMRAGDPNGVWLMQGWLFQSTGYWTNPRIEAYLSSVPNDGMIILDLYSETIPIWQKTNNYFGKPWIYCLLHNFGGDLGMRGDLPTIGSEVVNAKGSANGTLVGVGLTMEGIFQNYVVYELMMEMSWNQEKIDTEEWLEGYANRRYGAIDQRVQNAWKTLGRGVYNCTRCYGGVPKNVIVWRPHFLLDRDGFMGSRLGYNPNDVLEAWSYLLASANEFSDKDTYRYDLVDITRQAISNAIFDKYKEMVRAYNTTKDGCSSGKDILNMINDLQLILSCHREFLLGKWIEDSRALGDSDDEKDYYEYQARNQVTRWGDNNKNSIGDYASKQWAGLMDTYYHWRWNTFVEHLCQQEKIQQQVNFTFVNQRLEEYELKWQLDTTKFPTSPTGDAVFISQMLFEKYRVSFKKSYVYESDLCPASKAIIYFKGRIRCID